jgi:hypothetical protein
MARLLMRSERVLGCSPHSPRVYQQAYMPRRIWDEDKFYKVYILEKNMQDVGK